jgi:signal transduction histidine kinase/putative methionine-R-sulfoxide reductase with GAF domain
VSPLIWLGAAAYAISAVVAVSLTLTVLTVGPKHALNRLCALFTSAEAIWAASGFLLALTSWLEMSSAAFVLELAVLAFAVMGPLLLLFAARYVGCRTLWIDLAAVLGLVVFSVLAIPLFRHQLVFNPRLVENRLIYFDFGIWGHLGALLLAAYLACSLILFWRGRRRRGGWYLVVSVLILLTGMVVGGTLQPGFPVMSFTSLFSVSVLGYGIVSRQLLNPLKELTTRLEHDIRERTWELEEAYREVERAYAEVESWVDERTAELQREIAERKRVEAERASLLRALQHRSNQLQTAAEVSKSASMILDPDTLIDQTVHLIRERFNFYYVGLFLLDETGEYAVLQAGTGDVFGQMLRGGHKLEVGGPSMIGWCTAHGEARIALDVGEEAVRFDNPLLPETRSEMALPLISRGQCIGALSVQSIEQNAFAEEDVAVLQTMVDQVAIAIENARLLGAERKRGAELEALRQASLHVTSSLELQPVLEAIIEHTLRLVSADNTHIFLYEDDELDFGAAMWAGGLQREPYAEPRPNGMTYMVARRGEQVVIPDVDVHPLFKDRRWGGAVAGFPLRVGSDVCGVMNVAFEQPHVFTASELNVLELLADQAAVAIHNARMHQQVRAHADELAVALAQQEELDRLKGEFIQNVSHELRLPLALIRGYAEILDGGELGELQSYQQHPVTVIARRSRMLSELVEDITLILGAETRPPEWEPVALHEIVRVAVDEFRIRADETGLTLQADIADVPPVSGSLIYLRRVLDNLLNNAIKFTPEGGKITVRVWQEDARVLLEVRDTGIGIPDDQLERIFDRFYQVDGSIRRRYGGVGLGLALVKELVDLHGGRVEVESQVGEGSAFIVILPVSEKAGADGERGD